MNLDVARLAEAVEKNNELLADVLRQNLDRANLATIVVGHQRTLYGEDGRAGIVGDVSTLKTTQENCPARQAAQLPIRQGQLANWLSLAAFILATLAFLAQLWMNKGSTP